MLWQIDSTVFHAVNGAAGVNETLDFAVRIITRNDLVKGIPVMLVWWGLWFSQGEDRRRLHAGLLSVLIGAIMAIVAGRALAALLPFRLRPLHDPAFDAVSPIGSPVTTLDGWSSMPSDHAVLFFAMATSILFLNRTAGLLLLAHATLVVGLPRVFMGYHYPSDIVVGAAIGCLIAVLLWRPTTTVIERSGLVELQHRAGHLFYPALFLITYQAGTMFNDGRSALAALARVALQLVR